MWPFKSKTERAEITQAQQCAAGNHQSNVILGPSRDKFEVRHDGYRWAAVSEEFIFCSACREWWSKAIPARRLWQEREPDDVRGYFLLGIIDEADE